MGSLYIMYSERENQKNLYQILAILFFKLFFNMKKIQENILQLKKKC